MNIIREVCFISRPHAEMKGPYGREAIISITGSGSMPARLMRGWRLVLRLVFDDLGQKGSEGIKFNTSHADAIFKWLKRAERRVERIFVHCNAGRHRSAAVAKIIAEIYDLEGFNHSYELYDRRVYRVMKRQWRSIGGGDNQIKAKGSKRAHVARAGANSNSGKKRVVR